MNGLNKNLISGVKVLAVYDDFSKIKNLAYLDCVLSLEYDNGISDSCIEQIKELFSREEVVVEKRTKNGPKSENIIPMIRRFEISSVADNVLQIKVRVCCQNPSLNPMQLMAAIELYLPEAKPDFVSCRREEVYDFSEAVFR